VKERRTCPILLAMARSLVESAALTLPPNGMSSKVFSRLRRWSFEHKSWSSG
jgi:hypothetical protein